MKFTTLALSAFFIILFSQNIAATDFTATQIMQKYLDRDDGSTSYSKSTLISCNFKTIKNNKKCISQPRQKSLESLEKDLGEKNKDKIMLSIVLDPPSERGMAFLQKDYDDPSKDSDQWM